MVSGTKHASEYTPNNASITKSGLKSAVGNLADSSSHSQDSSTDLSEYLQLLRALPDSRKSDIGNQ